MFEINGYNYIFYESKYGDFYLKIQFTKASNQFLSLIILHKKKKKKKTVKLFSFLQKYYFCFV